MGVWGVGMCVGLWWCGMVGVGWVCKCVFIKRTCKRNHGNRMHHHKSNKIYVNGNDDDYRKKKKERKKHNKTFPLLFHSGYFLYELVLVTNFRTFALTRTNTCTRIPNVKSMSC